MVELGIGFDNDRWNWRKLENGVMWTTRAKEEVKRESFVSFIFLEVTVVLIEIITKISFYLSIISF